jgi:hypothetical protein
VAAEKMGQDWRVSPGLQRRRYGGPGHVSRAAADSADGAEPNRHDRLPRQAGTGSTSAASPRPEVVGVVRGPGQGEWQNFL